MPATLKRRGSVLLIDGLDISKPGEYVSDNAATRTENFTVKRGLLKKRTGTTSFGSAVKAEEIMNGREFIREAVKYNVMVGLDKIQRYDTGTSAWVDITGTDLTGTTNDLVDMAVPLLSSKEILCITNGVDAIRKWTATGNTDILGGTPPVAKFIQEYKTYLVCANITGGTDVGQRVQWCDTGDPENWSTGNSGSVDLIEDNEDITGLNIFSDYVCVHKPSSIYLGGLVSSSAIFRFDRRSVGKGTIANNTIINLPTNEQIYLADDGIRIFNGVSSVSINSSTNIEIRDSLNQRYAFKSWSVLVSEEDEVWIAVPLGSQTTPDTIYRYNYLTKVLYKDTRSGITAAWRAVTVQSSQTWDDLVGTWDEQTWRWDDVFVNQSFSNIFLGSSAGETYTVSWSAYDDGTDTISSVWSSKDYQGEEIGQLCRWSEMQLWAKGSGNLTVEYSVDEGSTWYELTGSPVALTTEFPVDSAPTFLYFDVVSTLLRVQFRNNETGAIVYIKQFKLGYRPRELRQ